MGDAPKTISTDGDVAAFVAAVPNARRRRDAERLLALFREVTGQQPRMWGPSIIGFGSYHYRYGSGREGDMAAAGFSPRAAATSIYLADGFGEHETLLARLGVHTRGAGCLYVKDLDAVDLDVLAEIVRNSYATLTAGTFGTRLSGPTAGRATDGAGRGAPPTRRSPRRRASTPRG